MDWSALEQRQPALADLGRRRLIAPGVVLVATIRRDGTPRLSPVEPYLMDGQLLLSMLWGSRKAQDLLRDPRVLVHSIITSRDGGEGEFKVRGTARLINDVEMQQRYADGVARDLGWSPTIGSFHLFAIDLDHVTHIRYDDATGDQYVAIWPPSNEFVRRGTSATTVGEPQPHHDLLIIEE